jgi:hypothetical protein
MAPKVNCTILLQLSQLRSTSQSVRKLVGHDAYFPGLYYATLHRPVHKGNETGTVHTHIESNLQYHHGVFGNISVTAPGLTIGVSEDTFLAFAQIHCRRKTHGVIFREAAKGE